jgi:hypothetical protein
MHSARRCCFVFCSLWLAHTKSITLPSSIRKMTRTRVTGVRSDSLIALSLPLSSRPQ